ncbi:MAG: hypothetical protein KAJ73_02275 [Zetaproteobacteria bacterium]|nr:hypothetical protein [Zetaproteobacteria bacterium]
MTLEIHLGKAELDVGALVEALQQFSTDLKIQVQSYSAENEEDFNSMTLTLYQGQDYVELAVWEGY